MPPASAVPTTLLFACLMAVPAIANANPDVEACNGKAQGDACGIMKMVKPADGGELQRKTIPGACRTDECCDLDYSKGSPPETVCSPCLACKEGPADVTATPPPADGGQTQDVPPRAGYADGPPPATPAQNGGCSVQGSPVGGAPWLMGLLLALPRRRRR
ncbi:MAG: hypothetical protein K0V04_38705 [Deltaproteobacteria bacterium]|nr:hypothetical protein [Deltaproteobacteria bacterium]